VANEADTCLKYVLPKLIEGGWHDDDPLRRFYFDYGHVDIVAQLVYELDPDGNFIW